LVLFPKRKPICGPEWSRRKPPNFDKCVSIFKSLKLRALCTSGSNRKTLVSGSGVDRQPDEIEKEPSTLAPKSDESTVLIPIERQIQQRGRAGGHELDDRLQAECEIKGRQANAAAA